MTKDGKFVELTLTEFDQWLKDNEYSRKILLIQNHHTYAPDYATYNKNLNKVSNIQWCKNIETYHIKTNGWSEIAQNITTFPDGKIVLCRDFNKIPAGIKGANSNGICVEHIGNFDLNCDTMSDEHRKTIIGVNALLCREFRLTPSDKTIIYHHWFDLISGKRLNGKGITKSCPGTNFFGGNTVESFNSNLLPLVINSMI